MQHLFVSFVIVEWDDGDAVVDLVRERKHGVVHDDYVFDFEQVGVDDPQILDEVAAGCLDTVLAVEAVLEQLPVRVDVVQDGICVHLVPRSEHDDHEVLAGLDQALHDVGPDVDPSVHWLLVREPDLDDHVSILLLHIVNAVNERLDHVEDDQLLLVDWVPGRWELDDSWRRIDLLAAQDVRLDDLQSLAGLQEVLLVQVVLLFV